MVKTFIKSYHVNDHNILSKAFPKNKIKYNFNEVSIKYNITDDEIKKFGVFSQFIKFHDLIIFFDDELNNSNNRFLKFLPRISIKHLFKFYLYLLSILSDDIEFFSKKHNLSLSSSASVKIFYNMVTFYFHHMIFHEKIIPTKSYKEIFFVISALHPLQDDYIDLGNTCKITLENMKEKVRGNLNVKCYDKNADKIFYLIDFVYEKYPPLENPILVDIFCELNNSQMLSKNQNKPLNKLSQKEILEISFKKGGYAFLLFSYVLLDGKIKEQFTHFYTMGAIFQILDDFHDIKEDLKSNTLTIWTNDINNKSSLDKSLIGLMNIQIFFEKNIKENKKYKYNHIIRMMEILGSKYSLFRFYCMQRKYFTDDFKRKMDSQFQFDIEPMSYFYKKIQKIEDINVFNDLTKELFKR